MKEPAKESDFYMIKNEKKSTQMFSSEGMFTEKVYPYLKRVRDVLVPGKRRMMYATMYPSFSVSNPLLSNKTNHYPHNSYQILHF